MPSARVVLELADRKRVEELVRDEDHRCFRDLVETRMPTSLDPRAAERGLLLGKARSASAISVPRPGPSSTRSKREGAPMRAQQSAVHKPISSPNIWEISGAVTKSPAAPKGVRVR